MAWFSNLAGKAEDLLNRLDQNASIALQNDSIKDRKHSIDNHMFNNTADIVEVSIEPADSELDSSYEKQSQLSIRSSESDVSISEMPAQMFSENSVNDVYLHNVETLSNDSPADVKFYTNSDSSLSMHNEKNEDNSVLQYLQNKNTELETKCFQYQEQLSILEKLLSESKDVNVKLKHENKQTLASLSTTRQEMEKHRTRAQKILQEKERLITQMENTPIISNDNGEQHIEHISKLVKIRDDQKKEIVELNEKLEVIQNDLMSVQKQCSLYEQKSFEATQNIQEERKVRLSLEEELFNKRQELQKALNKIEDNSQLIQLKEQEMKKLQKQVKERSITNENDELKSKFHILTQTLITKQKAVETLTTERNALRLQLEKTESEHRRALSQLKKKQAMVLITDDEKLHMNEQRAKKQFTFETFISRLFSYLRRYPIARMFLICYMIVLQIWIVILFSYILNNH